MTDVPVVLLVFNRPEITARTFAAIRAARPATLLVVADGPRPDRPGEAALCAATRAVVAEPDWPCRVLRDYSETNLGCGRRVASGLDWAFERVDQAIVLEDDCRPDASFFPYCAELLERYRDDPRVMMISGDNFQDGRLRGPASYYFSRYPHVWGWASWRRAWRRYDFTMAGWPELAKTGEWLGRHTADPLMAAYWRRCFTAAASGRVDTWDYQWLFACWAHDGLAVAPNRNLVENIGFGADATHTTGDGRRLALPAAAMDFPLRHPAEMAPCAAADTYEERHHYLSGRARLKARIKHLLGRP